MAETTSIGDPAGPEPFPRLIAFDLDYTLWDLWIDTHVTGPLKRPDNALNKVVDKYGEIISFYKDVPHILHTLHTRGRGEVADIKEKVVIAVCSRTYAPDLARQCLQLLHMPPAKQQPSSTAKSAFHFFDEFEIYPSSKLKHFIALHERTGIPYSEMLFFDDEHRNVEVEKLGVTFILVSSGLNWRVFDDGLNEWRKRKAKEGSTDTF